MSILESVKKAFGYGDEPTVEPAKTAAESQFDPDKPISSMIDLGHLYRVKGHGGLHFPASRPMSSGMIGMRKWSDNISKTVHQSTLQNLGQFVVFKTETKERKGADAQVGLGEIFDNIYKHFGERLVERNELTREIACPDFDGAKFKGHHLNHVVKWYNEIIGKAISNVESTKEAA